MDNKNKILMIYLEEVKNYKYDKIEINADEIFENFWKINDNILKIVSDSDKEVYKNMFEILILCINKKNIDLILNSLQKMLKKEEKINKKILILLRSNKNLATDQLRELYNIENYYKLPKPSKLKKELEIFLDIGDSFDFEFENDLSCYTSVN